MNAERLEKIKARCEKASPAPWMRNGKGTAGWRIDDGSDRVGVAFLLSPTALVRTREDVDFIAAAREDVPDLVERVRKLEAALRAQSDFCNCTKPPGGAHNEGCPAEQRRKALEEGS